jgi:hypothetical protein
MCWAMYLFTDDEVQEIERDNNNQKLYIKNIKKEKMNGGEANLLKWDENNKNIYYIGSSQGCGCGWKGIQEYHLNNMGYEEQTEICNKIKDRIDLYNLLKLCDLNNSYIIICWEGDQGEEVEEEKLNIEDIKNINYEFYELIKMIICWEGDGIKELECIGTLNDAKNSHTINYEFEELKKYRLVK